MKKRRKCTPTLFDKFCTKFGPSILKVCRFIDKQTHGFFEYFAWIVTGGAYQPRPYKDPEDTKKTASYSSYRSRASIKDSMAQDMRSIMGDFCSVQGDISKAVRRVERDNPEVAKTMQEAKNSPQFQRQAQIVRQRMAEVQQRCNRIHHICSHPTTVGTGNTSEREKE